jgi:hypothetical protein
MYTAARNRVNRNDHFYLSQEFIAARVPSARYFSPGARRHSADFSIESFRLGSKTVPNKNEAPLGALRKTRRK